MILRNDFTFYWGWAIGRLSFQIWVQASKRYGVSCFKGKQFGFYRRSDGGWLLRFFPDCTLMWDNHR